MDFDFNKNQKPKESFGTYMAAIILGIVCVLGFIDIILKEGMIGIYHWFLKLIFSFSTVILYVYIALRAFYYTTYLLLNKSSDYEFTYQVKNSAYITMVIFITPIVSTLLIFLAGGYDSLNYKILMNLFFICVFLFPTICIFIGAVCSLIFVIFKSNRKY